ncbi:MAG: hypothetical protein HQK76_19775 [Desulfobacterales bacterium]|nr:hypothetical protein [Desulfobacterales bacterium]
MMKKWWESIDESIIAEIINKVNLARYKDHTVEKCRSLFEALNLTWNEYYYYRRSNNMLTGFELDKRIDSDAFIQLLQGLNYKQQRYLSMSNELNKLVYLTPRIMDNSILRSLEYDPNNITDDIRLKAEEKHTDFIKYFNKLKRDRFISEEESIYLKKFIKSFAKLLYLVRSNIAHGEKTPKGPDRNKAARDENVSGVVSLLLFFIIDFIFDNPSKSIATYDTLIPGQNNEEIFSKVTGIWTDGFIEGLSYYDGSGLPAFRWELNSKLVPVKIFQSNQQLEEYEELDKLKGPDYTRIWIPAKLVNGSKIITHIYETRY